MCTRNILLPHKHFLFFNSISGGNLGQYISIRFDLRYCHATWTDGRLNITFWCSSTSTQHVWLITRNKLTLLFKDTERCYWCHVLIIQDQFFIRFSYKSEKGHCLYSDNKQTLCTSLGLTMTKHHQLKLDTFLKLFLLAHKAQHNSKKSQLSKVSID